MFHLNKPNLDTLRIFGSPCSVTIPDAKRKETDLKTYYGRLLGHEMPNLHAYSVLLKSGKVFISREVMVDENFFSGGYREMNDVLNITNDEKETSTAPIATVETDSDDSDNEMTSQSPTQGQPSAVARAPPPAPIQGTRGAVGSTPQATNGTSSEEDEEETHDEPKEAPQVVPFQTEAGHRSSRDRKEPERYTPAVNFISALRPLRKRLR
jgi:hypothetical protein